MLQPIAVRMAEKQISKMKSIRQQASDKQGLQRNRKHVISDVTPFDLPSPVVSPETRAEKHGWKKLSIDK